MSKNKSMYVKSRHHQRGYHQRTLHAKVCGKKLETVLQAAEKPTDTPLSKLTEFCVLPKTHEGDVHMVAGGKTWNEEKKTVVEAVQIRVAHCPECGTTLNPFGKAFFCPKQSKVFKSDEITEGK